MPFKNMPIRRKLTAIILVTSGAVLLLTCSAFIAYEFFTFRQSMVRNIATLGEVVATNSTAALEFDNRDDATEILSALRAEHHIVAAGLYDRNGKLFSQYPTNLPATVFPAAPEPDGYRFAGSHLGAFLPVKEGSRRIGTLYLQSDMEAMYERFWLYGGIVVLVIAASFLMAYLLSRGLQKQISQPILTLAETAKAISERQDYSVRATKQGEDELGLLTDAFNQMLAQIHEHDAALRASEARIQKMNEALEQRVSERTADLRRAHEELSRANGELGQASKLKDEFLANMSHELRTPLNAILGLSEALLEQVSGPLTPRQVKSVTTISTSGTHLLALINDILDLSKIEAGMRELHLDKVNVQEFCESCLVFVRTQAMQKKIDVAFESDRHMPELSADPKRLKQILVNLLTNAVKFTPEGGRIGLTVAAPEGEDVVRFTVWDTGIGIAKEDAAKLFRAFTQIDSGLSRAQEGTGLGLALVAKLVELHGGSVALESEPGQGSRFTVTLPRVAAPASAQEPAAKARADRRGYSRALIIEDDPTSGAILADYLTELGLSSALHVRGGEAVEAVQRERPDVIMLDIQLPGESGWVVLTKLKEHPGTRDIPVVVISVVDEPKKSLSLGAAAHFTKPITRPQLAGFLQRDAVSRLLPAPPCIALPAPTGPTILLAEDNEANVQTIGGYLEDKGYAMHYARNGLVAVQLARELRPALILMDIQMPVMDGLTAIREIRADAAMKAIPIVALTALAMPGDRERCLAAGATDYLSKPVSLKALTALVDRLLPAAEGGR